MRAMRLLPNHAGILAAKRTLDRIGVILHGYDLNPDGSVKLHLEDRHYDRALAALEQDGFTVESD